MRILDAIVAASPSNRIHVLYLFLLAFKFHLLHPLLVQDHLRPRVQRRTPLIIFGLPNVQIRLVPAGVVVDHFVVDLRLIALVLVDHGVAAPFHVGHVDRLIQAHL